MSTVAEYGIITPEAVVLELASAGLTTRAVAKLIDLMIQALTLIVLFILVGLISTQWQSGAAVMGFIVVFVVLFVAPMVVETVWNGKSPGKAIFGLRVVTADGGPIQFRHAAVRGILQIIDVYAGIGVLPALFSRRSQRFGDFLAGTFVLSDRVATTRAQAILFIPPPGCEQYIGAMDVGRVTHRQYSTVRQFLLRVGELAPGSRLSVATRLAEALRAMTSPPPPQWMSSELFLICVASAYQLRSGTLPREALVPRQAITTPFGYSSPHGVPYSGPVGGPPIGGPPVGYGWSPR